jgi:hypothetical protein
MGLMIVIFNHFHLMDHQKQYDHIILLIDIQMISKQKIISYQSINYPECRMIGDHQGGDDSDCDEAICLQQRNLV